jgi:hypothetical protein
LLLAVGVVLWAAGRRVLRAGFAVTGLIIGGLMGWILTSGLGINIDPWIPAFILGVIVACVAALTYRLAVAGALAVVIGVAAPMGVSVVDEVRDAGDDAEVEGVGESVETDDEATGDLVVDEQADEYDLFFGRDDLPTGGPNERQENGATDAQADAAEGGADGGASDLPASLRDAAVDEAARDAAERVGIDDDQLDAVREHAKQILAGVKEWWASQPERLRPALISAGIAGFLLGALLGTLAPMASASAVTAFGGSLLWLSSVRVLAVSTGLGGGWIPDSAAVNLVVWIAVAVIGIGIQWTLRRKEADESS